ncbi:MAG: pentapeptide repeat-containing protein [Nostoc sp. JL33]|nr:pentapeptide repeat-containing protein [Nostoc sp. JL33]MBN3874758.1 pentapeptide repeat-containing protein [Nostoc sp. JL33]
MSQQKILIGDIISRYAAGERDFSEVIIETPSRKNRYWERGQFKGLDLSGIILRNSSIQWIKLYMGGVILRDADLTNVDLGESDFTGADLSNARMRGVRIFQSVFERANLSGADLAGASLVESDFYCADLSRVKLRNARIRSMGFVRTDLTEATFKRARLGSVSFEKAELSRTDFREAKFRDDRVFGVNFRDCLFEETLMPDGSVRSDN